jgi:hypothetical protein
MRAMPEHIQDDETEPAHDILAAEEFGMPAADPDLHHGPVVLPDDPSTSDEPPHDVLAAEQFAMPAVHQAHPPGVIEGGRSTAVVLARVAAAFVVALLLARRLRRR